MLASLGINNFYTGTDATDIAVNQTLVNSQPQMPVRPRRTARLTTTRRRRWPLTPQLGSQPVTALGGSSLNDTYQAMINGVAAQDATAAAKTNAQRRDGRCRDDASVASADAHQRCQHRRGNRQSAQAAAGVHGCFQADFSR